MIKIGLFCAAGFSTGMLVNNMKIAAKEAGLEVEIDAYSQAKLADYAPNLDIALLGPQVAYTLDKSAAICEENHIFPHYLQYSHHTILFPVLKIRRSPQPARSIFPDCFLLHFSAHYAPQNTIQSQGSREPL